MRQSTSERRSKIELTCRLSAEKLRGGVSKEQQVVTPPRSQPQPILTVDQEEVTPITVENDKAQPKRTHRKTSNLQIDIECIEDEYARKTVVKAPIYQGTPLFASVATATK